MKTLVRSLMVGLIVAALGGAAPLAAQRVVVDVRIGTPDFHTHRHYRHGHRVYHRQHRHYARWHGRPVIVVSPRAHYHRLPVVVHRPIRVHRHSRWH